MTRFSFGVFFWLLSDQKIVKMPEFIQPVTDRQSCYKCHKTVTGRKRFSKCSKCHAIAYCGKQCQVADWPRHAFNCVPVMVTEYEGKGRGVVAARDIKMGECIFMDKPLLKLPLDPSEAHKDLDSLMKQLENLPSEAKLLFYKIDGRGRTMDIRGYKNEVMERFYANAGRAGDWWIFFLNAALLNHSCAPNAFADTFDQVSGEPWCEVRAIKDISKGEEVTVFYEIQKPGTLNLSYYMYGCNAQERRAAIWKELRFYCKCSACSGNDSEQDKIIKELLKLHKALDQSRKKPSMLSQEVKTLDQIVDLNLGLYIGSVDGKIWALQSLGTAAARAGNEDLIKKASDGLKKLTEEWKIYRIEKVCQERGLDF